MEDGRATPRVASIYGVPLPTPTTPDGIGTTLVVLDEVDHRLQHELRSYPSEMRQALCTGLPTLEAARYLPHGASYDTTGPADELLLTCGRSASHPSGAATPSVCSGRGGRRAAAIVAFLVVLVLLLLLLALLICGRSPLDYVLCDAIVAVAEEGPLGRWRDPALSDKASFYSLTPSPPASPPSADRLHPPDRFRWALRHGPFAASSRALVAPPADASADAVAGVMETGGVGAPSSDPSVPGLVPLHKSWRGERLRPFWEEPQPLYRFKWSGPLGRSRGPDASGRPASDGVGPEQVPAENGSAAPPGEKLMLTLWADRQRDAQQKAERQVMREARAAAGASGAKRPVDDADRAAALAQRSALAKSMQPADAPPRPRQRRRQQVMSDTAMVGQATPPACPEEERSTSSASPLVPKDSAVPASLRARASPERQSAGTSDGTALCVRRARRRLGVEGAPELDTAEDGRDGEGERRWVEGRNAAAGCNALGIGGASTNEVARFERELLGDELQDFVRQLMVVARLRQAEEGAWPGASASAQTKLAYSQEVGLVKADDEVQDVLHASKPMAPPAAAIAVLGKASCEGLSAAPSSVAPCKDASKRRWQTARSRRQCMAPSATVHYPMRSLPVRHARTTQSGQRLRWRSSVAVVAAFVACLLLLLLILLVVLLATEC